MKSIAIILVLIPLFAAQAQAPRNADGSIRQSANADTIVVPETTGEQVSETEKVFYPGETPLPSESDFVPGETPPEESPVVQTVNEADQVVVGKDEEIVFSKGGGNRTEDHRRDSKHSIMLGYQFLTTWLPSKLAFNYTYIHSEDWSWDLEYAYAGINSSIIGVDLGEISEKRYSLLGRRYVGNSFHFILGPYYQDFTARASGKVVGQGLDVATFGAEGFGGTLGLGNRWQWKNGITLGIDWLRVNVPLYTTDVDNEILKDINNNSDSEDVKNVIRAFNRIPTFVVFGVNVGYTF